MRYTKPFTLVQRQRAIKEYRSLRTSYDQMRFDFPPYTVTQRELLTAFRDDLHDFRAELRKKDANLDVDALNVIGERAVRVIVDYSSLWNAGSSGHG